MFDLTGIKKGDTVKTVFSNDHVVYGIFNNYNEEKDVLKLDCEFLDCNVPKNCLIVLTASKSIVSIEKCAESWYVPWQNHSALWEKEGEIRI